MALQWQTILAQLEAPSVSSLQLEKVLITQNGARMLVCFLADQLVGEKDFLLVKRAFARAFPEVRVSLRIASPALAGDFRAHIEQYRDFLIGFLVRHYPAVRSWLTSGQWTLDEQGILQLGLELPIAVDYFGQHKLAERLSRAIDDVFRIQVPVQVVLAGNAERTVQRMLEERRQEEQRLQEEMQRTQAKIIKMPVPPQKKQQIYGRSFAEKPVPMAELAEDAGRIVVQGEVVESESRELKGGELVLLTFTMTDYGGSCTCKLFLRYKRGRRNGDAPEGPITDAERKAVRDVLDEVKKGAYLRVQGEAQRDNYSKDTVLMVRGIRREEQPKRTDEAPEKRIELHLHTQMSNMDATASASELIALAASWGHEAIAVTDHGVVQAFPEAFGAAKKNKIKLLPGMEGYLTSETATVKQADERSLNRPIVVLDFETTGLSPQLDRIVEIGAVRIQNGQVVEEFGSMVYPGCSMPPQTTRINGITDAMLAGAPVAAEALPKLLAFIGDSAVAAHNAEFDMSFLREECIRLDLSISPPVIDTLELSRRLYPQLKSHRLGAICRHLKVPLKNAHRAVHDARATAHCLLRMIAQLEEQGIHTLVDLAELLHPGAIGAAYHIILLAKNQKGMENLNRLVSAGHLEYFRRRPHLPRALIKQHREGLILGTACESGELYQAFLRGAAESELREIASFYDYLEIQPLSNNSFLVREGRLPDDEALRDINRRIVALGEKLGKPVVATGDVHFKNPQDARGRAVLMASHGYKDADLQPELYLKTTGEMLEEFAYLGEETAYDVVIRNPKIIADMVGEVRLFPKHPQDEETFQPYWPEAADTIRDTSYAEAHRLYGDTLPGVVDKRLDKELKAIIGYGFATLYNVAQKLVQKSLSDGYLVGSRGSVGSSFVARLCGITEVNPLPPHYRCISCRFVNFDVDSKKYKVGVDLPPETCPGCGEPLVRDGFDIPFEVFLGFEGDKVPDIDLNFSGDYQSTAHAYVEELFGKENCFRAGTIGTLAEKTAFGYVLKYFEEREATPTEAEKRRLALSCVGVKRTTGQHPGGMVVVPDGYSIYQFTAIQRPADDPETPTITTHYDFGSMHDVLVKLDILGHDDPTMIRMLEDLTGVNALDIPLAETKVMTLFTSPEALGVTPEAIDSKTGTLGVPEMGTKFVRQMIEDTRPTTMEELIRISGLSHGTDVWLGNAQTLIEEGTATLSECICTRDDIMNALMVYGVEAKMAFDTMESVRKGRGLTEAMEQAMRDRQVPQWFIDSCKKIKYMFPKAHAVAYVTMALRIAWFKVYHPDAYYAAFFTIRAGSLDTEMLFAGPDTITGMIRDVEAAGNKQTAKEKEQVATMEMVREMRARNIRFAPVDLYTSDAARFIILEPGVLLPPLNAVTGLGESACRSVVSARAEGAFTSVEDLKERAHLSSSNIDTLRSLGCLDTLPDTSQLTLFSHIDKSGADMR